MNPFELHVLVVKSPRFYGFPIVFSHGFCIEKSTIHSIGVSRDSSKAMKRLAQLFKRQKLEAEPGKCSRVFCFSCCCSGMFWDFSRFCLGPNFQDCLVLRFFFQGLYVLLVILSS